MGLTTFVGMWMLVKMAGPSSSQPGGDSYQTIGYFLNQTECVQAAAPEQNWKCMKRPDLEDAIKKRGERFKLD